MMQRTAATYFKKRKGYSPPLHTLWLLSCLWLLAAPPAAVADSYEMGLQLYEKGDYAAASQYLRRAVYGNGKESENPNIRYYLADTYLKLGRLAEAQAEYQAVMAMAPNSQAARMARVVLARLRETLEKPVSSRWGALSGEEDPASGVDRYTGPVELGNDYLDDVLQGGRVLRWSLSKMPLKVYVERSPVGIRNFQPAFVNQVNRSLEPWVNALGRQLSYELVSSPEQADIRVKWINTIDTKGQSLDGGTGYTAGLTIPTIRNNQLEYMEIRIATFDITGRPQDEHTIGAVAIHEFGHALGLMGHSSQPGDIMYDSNESATTLSTRDINTIRRLYTLTADVNNLPADSRSQNKEREKELAAKMDDMLTKMEQQAKKDDRALSWLNLGIEYYQKALQVEKEGKPHVESDSWFHKALTAINQALQKEPNDPRAYHCRSLVYQGLGDFNQALLDIEKAISLDRKEPVYYMLDAYYLAKLGQKARAKSALDTYLLHRPDEAKSDDVKLILEALKQSP